MSGPPMQSEPRPENVQDYGVSIHGHLHDATPQDAKNFCKAIKEHMLAHGSTLYKCKLEALG